MHVMVPLELSCNSPVFLGSGIVVHGGVHGVTGKGFEEPVGRFPLLIDGDALGWEQFMSVDGLIDADGAQAVQPIMFDIGGEDMDGLVAISDWDEKVEDISFVLFIALWSSCLPFPVSIPLVSVHLPVLIGCFQMSCMCLALCQIFSSLAEYFKLFLIVVANFLIFSHNSHQSLCNEEEFLSSRGTVPFKSSTP